MRRVHPRLVQSAQLEVLVQPGWMARLAVLVQPGWMVRQTVLVSSVLLTPPVQLMWALGSSAQFRQEAELSVSGGLCVFLRGQHDAAGVIAQQEHGGHSSAYELFRKSLFSFLHFFPLFIVCGTESVYQKIL